MQDTNPTEDLLQGDDLQEVTYRSLLMPRWFKICLGYLIYAHFSSIYGLAEMQKTLRMLSGDAYTITLWIYAAFILVSLATVVTCALFYFQSRLAVTVGVPVLIAALLLGALSIVGFFAGNYASTWLLIGSVLNLVALIVVIVYSIRIRKQWAEAIVVR
jgi:hypothetical protein